MAEKPSLHEIAAMPHSQTIAAVRKFYDPQWGLEPVDEGAVAYSVRIDWSYTVDETDFLDIRADNPGEAEKKAREMWEEENGRLDNAEIDRLKVSEVGQ